MHYQRWRIEGDPLWEPTFVRAPRNPGGLCAVDGCESKQRKREWCGKHYAMWRRTGEPDTAPSYQVHPSGGTCLACGSPDLMPGSRRACSPTCLARIQRAKDFPDAVLQSKPCQRCGADIDLMSPGRTRSNRAKDSSRKRRADSALCADCRRQRGYRHKWSAQALAARDGTDCGICLEPVDMTLSWPNLDCPSVDHIVSRADGGTDDPANLQLAHLRCNHRKSKRSHWMAA